MRNSGWGSSVRNLGSKLGGHYPYDYFLMGKKFNPRIGREKLHNPLLKRFFKSSTVPYYIHLEMKNSLKRAGLQLHGDRG